MVKKETKQKIVDLLVKQEIIDATNEFARRVTEDNGMERKERAVWINKVFAKDARLRPTVGQVIRTKESKPTEIEAYFRDYFSRSVIPGLSVVNANYDVVKIKSDLYANYAYVKFDTGEGTITAVMSFIFKRNKETDKWEILLLHSQPIHLEVPDSLVKQGDVFPYWDLPKPYGNL